MELSSPPRSSSGPPPQSSFELETVSSSVLVRDGGITQVRASSGAEMSSSTSSASWRRQRLQQQRRSPSDTRAADFHGGGGRRGLRIKFPHSSSCSSDSDIWKSCSRRAGGARAESVQCDDKTPVRRREWCQCDVETGDGIQHHPARRDGGASSMTALHPVAKAIPIADFCSTSEPKHGKGKRRRSSSCSSLLPREDEEESGVVVPHLHPVAAAGDAVADVGTIIRDGQREDKIVEDGEHAPRHRRRVAITSSPSPLLSRRSSCSIRPVNEVAEDGSFEVQDEDKNKKHDQELQILRSKKIKDELAALSDNPGHTFVLGERKGCGASAEVFECFGHLSEVYAIKVVTAKSKRQHANLREEVRLLQKCREEQCGHVVKMYRWAENLRKLRLVLLLECADLDLAAYIERFQNPPHSGDSSATEGGTVRSRTRCPPRGEVRRSGMPLYPTLFDCFRQMLRAVEEIHRQKVVHCDIKPANFLLFSGNIVKLADFGLARQIGSEDTHVSRDVQCGTPRYMAPECVFQPASLLLHCGGGSSSGSGSSGSDSEGEGNAKTGLGGSPSGRQLSSCAGAGGRTDDILRERSMLGVAEGEDEDAGCAAGSQNKSGLVLEPEAKRMNILNSVEPEAGLHQAEADDAQLQNPRRLGNRRRRRAGWRPPFANKLRRTPAAAFHVRASVDVWSLGVVLYSLLYLQAPFEELETRFCGARALMFAISDPRVEIRYPSLQWLAQKRARDLRLGEDASRSETGSAARSTTSEPELLAEDMFRHMVAVAQKCLQRAPADRWTCEELLEAWTRIERDFHDCQTQQPIQQADEARQLRPSAYLSSLSASGATASKGSGEGDPSEAQRQRAEQEHHDEAWESTQPLSAKEEKADVADDGSIPIRIPPLKPVPEPSGKRFLFLRYYEQQCHHVAVQVEEQKEKNQDCDCPSTGEKPFGFAVSDVVARAPELGRSANSPPIFRAPAATPSQPWDSEEIREQEDNIVTPSLGHGPHHGGVDADSIKGETPAPPLPSAIPSIPRSREGPAQAKTKRAPKLKRKPREAPPKPRKASCPPPPPLE